MIPTRIRDTLRAALRARISLAEYFADLPLAQQHMADVEEALAWLDGPEIEHAPVEMHAPSEYAGPVVHEDQRWPPFGASVGKRWKRVTRR